MNKWVVITSINGPQPRYADYIERGWSLVVVGDLKSPNKEFENWSSNFTFSSKSHTATKSMEDVALSKPLKSITTGSLSKNPGVAPKRRSRSISKAERSAVLSKKATKGSDALLISYAWGVDAWSIRE